MIVVGRRVDWLTLAFRVALDENLLDHLRECASVAKEHGRAGFEFRALEGEMRYRKGAGASWLVVKGNKWRVLIDLKAPGASEIGPGWTVEVVWYAQALADCVHVGQAIAESARMVETLGQVTETRVRRIDLCADVAGAVVEEADTARLVRRARARVATHRAGVEGMERQDDDTFARTFRAAERITGITVCPGGAIQCRLYDKRAELARDGSNGGLDKRAAEESRWGAEGWDGKAPILRVEFQIRGVAVKELGIRDPYGPRDADTGWGLPKDPHWPRDEETGEPEPGYESQALIDRLDAIWQRCCEWVRLVTPGVARKGRKNQHAERLSECEDAPLWTLVRSAVFLEKAPRVQAARRRIREGASSAQVFGCALSVLVAEGKISRVPQVSEPDPLGAKLDRIVAAMLAEAAPIVAEEMRRRWGDKALLHVAIVRNSALKRSDFARRWTRNAMTEAAA